LSGNPDVVVLAGDIDTGTRAVSWAEQCFAGRPVLYVMGNHESYGKNLEHVERDLQAACEATQNVHFLNCSSVELGGVRFLGTTLWTDFTLFGEAARPAAMTAAGQVMVDYHRIRLATQGFRKLRPADTARLHAQQALWLRQALATPFDGKTVVITHMAPTMRSVAERYATDLVSAAYASNLEEVAAQADLWIHGHMHDSFDYQIGKCRVVCNPRGYITRAGTPENSTFGAGYCVDMEAP